MDEESRLGKEMKRKYGQSGPPIGRTRPAARSALNNKEPAEGRTRRIVFVAGPGTEILDLVGPLQVFARAEDMFRRQNPGSPPIYSVEVVSVSSQRSLLTNCGVRLTAHKTFREVRGKIDTLLVAGGDAIEQDEINADVVRWLKKIAGRIRRIGSVCTGAMLLARAGLLDGRRATTHWNWCHTLIKRAPRTDVDPDPIFVRDENVYTSAGVTAGMDLALALVEEDYGSHLALQVARNLVLYLRRPGGQSQFSAALSLQATDRKPLRELESWVLDNLNRPLTVPVLAQRVAMSPRNFARVFTQEMKTTPAKFVERLRVEAARRRLEESQNSMETIASECGFGNINSMRSVFQRALKIAPGQYRRHFRHAKHRPRHSPRS
jgi:transcriptional regulator GlxA family with amidase domain